MAYVRTVKTRSGARAVQIVYSSRRGSRDIEHIGSAHGEAELAALRAVARQRLAVGQPELDLGLDDTPAAGGPLEITGSRMGHLWDALCRAYDVLDFDASTDRDEVFRQLVLARIIEATDPRSDGISTTAGQDDAACVGQLRDARRIRLPDGLDDAYPVTHFPAGDDLPLAKSGQWWPARPTGERSVDPVDQPRPAPARWVIEVGSKYGQRDRKPTSNPPSSRSVAANPGRR